VSVTKHRYVHQILTPSRNVRNRQCNRFWPKHIKAATFTHLIFAFASMDPKTFEMVPADPADVALYEQFTGLKSATLRTWIGVGGWEFVSTCSINTVFTR
jgi:chitinase